MVAFTDSIRVHQASSLADFPPLHGASPGVPSIPFQPQSPGRTFAQLLQTKHPQMPVTVHDDIIPVKKGDYFAVPIDEDFYQQRLKVCETTLIARLVFFGKGR